ncbi:MAG: U32 family peptidase [Planctomycetota bacterium]|jgi:putative protease|nr:U32 family peptidase [Planctomycetota bacterium]
MPSGNVIPDRSKPELLAPAGGPDAGYAALHYGADAVYLGLARHSARAEAVNFTPEQLAEFAAYAHSLPSRRQVYLALNTLIRQDELPAAAETAALAADCGVDAIIVQDLGVARLIRERFPEIALHASTQMAIHNLAGAEAAAEIGCSRVTLARELTLREVAHIASRSRAETEVFIHGTLCYSYSGLCLFSAMTTGRSGNRGSCAYSCRLAFADPSGRRSHPFSLKDLALGDKILELAEAGVASLKIEGRMKSPTYVAATVDYYRRILDGNASPEERLRLEARLKTIFARPWTRLFFEGKHNPEAADPEIVGHRGSGIGPIEALARTPAGPGIRFRPSLPLERHDGCQIDLPGQSRPFGFALEHLYLAEKGRLKPVFEVPAGAVAAAALPPDAPALAPGLPLYLASSQAVKRDYSFFRPKAGSFGAGTPIRIEISLEKSAAGPGAEVVCRGGTPKAFFQCRAELPVFPARDTVGAEEAARQAFSRLGGKRFALAGWEFRNPGAFFARPADWNRLRRIWLAGLEAELERRNAVRRSELAQAATGESPTEAGSNPQRRLALFADDPGSLAAFGTDDFAACHEVILGIGTIRKPEDLDRLSSLAGRDKLRLSPPVIHRGDIDGLITPWLERGWRRWLLPGLAGRRLLAGQAGLDFAADWTLPVLNRLAAEELLALGFSSFTLSPEDGEDNWRELIRRHPGKAWLLAHTDIPLFISAACVHSHLGLCPGGGGGACRNSGRGLELTFGKKSRVQAWPAGCGSVVTADLPFCPRKRLAGLENAGGGDWRVDLRWRPYRPDEALAVWRGILAGRFPAGSEGSS